MANERLRNSISSSGMSTGSVSEELGVDRKTVERWITKERVPYQRYRSELAGLLKETEDYFWPDAISTKERSALSESEVLKVYPHRASVPNEVWQSLFDRAEKEIDILVFAGLFLPEQNPKLIDSFCEKANEGVKIRIMLGDPDSQAVALRSEEEQIGDALPARVRNVLKFFSDHLDDDCFEFRLHQCTLYNSIFRCDDEMMINMHVYGLAGAHAPAMHLRRLDKGDLFSTYTKSFDQVWQSAKPIKGR